MNWYYVRAYTTYLGCHNERMSILVYTDSRDVVLSSMLTAFISTFGIAPNAILANSIDYSNQDLVKEVKVLLVGR